MKKLLGTFVFVLALSACGGGSSDPVGFNYLDLGRYDGHSNYNLIIESETGYCESIVTGLSNIQNDVLNAIGLEQAPDNRLRLRRLYHDGVHAGESLAVVSDTEDRVSSTETISLLREDLFPESTGCDGTLDTVFEAGSGSRIEVKATLHLLCLDGRATHSCEISEQAELEHDHAS